MQVEGTELTNALYHLAIIFSNHFITFKSQKKNIPEHNVPDLLTIIL